MKKRIVICADGTRNRPEKNLKEDVPTSVLRLARAIKPVGPIRLHSRCSSTGAWVPTATRRLAGRTARA